MEFVLRRSLETAQASLPGLHPENKHKMTDKPTAERILKAFSDIHVRVDLGYQGIQSDYRGDQIDIPTKKPRKSQKNPNPQLSDEQKAVNKALSQVRIFIEHAIGGMKRYNILVHVFRNRKADFEDDAVGICAGLWNLALSY